MPLVMGAGRTEKGHVRKKNDDAFRIFCSEEIRDKGRGCLFAVADGIGSYRAGGQAAQMTVDQIGLYFQYPDDQFDGPKTLVDQIWKANEAITRLRTGQKEYYGMGCTLTALLTDAENRRGIIYQVGDSMAYLLRHSALTPINDVHQDPESGELTNHMGLGPLLKLDRVRFVLQPEDRILLCSDGLNGYLDEDEILAIMVRCQEPQECVDALMDVALEKSSDNITIVVVRVTPDPA